MPDLLRSFTSTAFQEAGTLTVDADRLAELLVLTDLRGVFSHGTRQLAGYIEMILSGKVNPRPQVECIDQSQTTAVFDGDGGMGHLPAYLAARMAVNMAKDMGVGAVTTRNHLVVLESIRGWLSKRIVSGLLSLHIDLCPVPVLQYCLLLERLQ